MCDDCHALLDVCEFNYCLCSKNPSRFFPGSKNPLLGGKDGKCQKCRDKKLAGLYFALPYKEKTLTKKLIYQFKYKPYLKDLSKTLASILIEHFVKTGKNTNEIWENSVLIPVPLSKEKLKIRGYNQSEELAKELSKILEVPVISNVLVKIKETESQMKLKKEAREKNLLNAFAISSPSLRGAAATKQSLDFKNKKVFLVDDVYTSGSTMQECARVLKNAGAKSVWGIALAREE